MYIKDDYLIAIIILMTLTLTTMMISITAGIGFVPMKGRTVGYAKVMRAGLRNLQPHPHLRSPIENTFKDTLVGGGNVKHLCEFVLPVRSVSLILPVWSVLAVSGQPGHLGIVMSDIGVILSTRTSPRR